jgi:hypothetical protein
MEADTPKRSATAPTFSASPTFRAERAAFFLRSVGWECEFEEALDNGPLSIAVNPFNLVCRSVHEVDRSVILNLVVSLRYLDKVLSSIPAA